MDAPFPPPSRPEWTPYLLHIIQEHATFRVPELYSCAQVHGFDIRIPVAERKAGAWDADEVGRPGLVVWLRSEEDARKIAERCVLVKCVQRSGGSRPGNQTRNDAVR